MVALSGGQLGRSRGRPAGRAHGRHAQAAGRGFAIRHAGIAGTTLLGDGSVLLVLDLQEVLR